MLSRRVFIRNAESSGHLEGIPVSLLLVYLYVDVLLLSYLLLLLELLTDHYVHHFTLDYFLWGLVLGKDFKQLLCRQGEVRWIETRVVGAPLLRHLVAVAISAKIGLNRLGLLLLGAFLSLVDRHLKLRLLQWLFLLLDSRCWVQSTLMKGS